MRRVILALLLAPGFAACTDSVTGADNLLPTFDVPKDGQASEVVSADGGDVTVPPQDGVADEGPVDGVEPPADGVVAPDAMTDVPPADGVVAPDTVTDASPADAPVGDTPPADVPVGDVPPADVPVDVSCDHVPAAKACTEEGKRRCPVTGGTVVEECLLVDGCLTWTDNEFCGDLGACTGEPTVCLAGNCVEPGDPDAKCEQPDDPCLMAVCESETGDCVDVPAEDGTECDDGDVCTENDYCFDGGCVGDNACPKACSSGTLDDLSCGDHLDIDLGGPSTTNVMGAYGCAGGESGYEGAEKTVIMTGESWGDCDNPTITLELANPAKWGTGYLDLFVLSMEPGLCYPSACLAVGFMNDEGKATIALADPLEKGKKLILVVDGRDGFVGKARLALSCDVPCTSTELFCSDGEDEADGDGSIDCADEDCSGQVCAYEAYHCADEIDNDGNGKTDCADPACGGIPECTGAGCDGTVPIACGETLTGQLVTDGTVTLDSAAFTCADGLDFYPPYLPETAGYELAPGEGKSCFQVHVAPEGGSGFFDIFGFDGGCQGAFCQAGDTWFIDPANLNVSLSMSGDAFLTVHEYDLGGAASPYAITLECCD